MRSDEILVKSVKKNIYGIWVSKNKKNNGGINNL